jgi:hypothetical protein
LFTFTLSGVLKADVVSIRNVKPLERIRLRQLLSRGHRGKDEDVVERIRGLDAVIFLKEKNRIRGVATFSKFKFELQFETALGVVYEQMLLESGDKYQKVLTRGLYRYLWFQKFKHPFSLVYCFTTEKLKHGNKFFSYIKQAGSEIVVLNSTDQIDSIKSGVP